jgi:hypothetical protein
MKLLHISKRQNELEKCLYLWTPWFTVVWDFGSVQCRGSDEFELVIKHKAWGPIFYFGNRDIEKLGERSKCDWFQYIKIQPRYKELRSKRIEERDFYEHREDLVRQGKRKNPADMTYAERHAATMEAVGKMKFSENFVHMLTTPVAKLALERGETVRDPDTGEVLTERIYDEHKQKNLGIPVRNVGILGFKRAKDGHSYEAICVPGAGLKQVAPDHEGQGLKLIGEGTSHD